MIPSTILTNTGRYFRFDRPFDHPFTIEEIAHSLAHLCRYTGHVREFYSVAQHSVLVSRVLPPELQLEGLLHDAAEAYLGDVASPLKRLLPDYKAIEHEVEAAIAARFQLAFPMPPKVKQADMEALMTERRDLMPGVPDDGQWGWVDVIPWRAMIRPWGPALAKQMFISTYYDIMERRAS